MEPNGRNHCHVIVTFLCYMFFHAYPSYSSGYLNQYGLMDVHPMGRDAIFYWLLCYHFDPALTMKNYCFTQTCTISIYCILREHFHIWNMTRLSRVMFQNSLCVWYTCKCICVSMCVDTCVSPWMFGGPRLTLNVFLCLYPPHMLRAGSLTMSEYAILATLLTTCSADSLFCLVSSEVGL